MGGRLVFLHQQELKRNFITFALYDNATTLIRSTVLLANLQFNQGFLVEMFC